MGGWTPAPLPPIGPDGAPVLTEIVSVPQVPSSICERGPCRKYHRFVTDADEATTPGGVASARQTIHTCYIAPGIEIDLQLGDRTFHECSLWDPELPTDPEVINRDARRRIYLASVPSADVEVEVPAPLEPDQESSE